MEGGKEGGREGGRDGGRDGGREGGRVHDCHRYRNTIVSWAPSWLMVVLSCS